MQTKDGYLLGLHRLQWRRGEEGQPVNSGRNALRKRVVYMHHGLLMNSEVWVCQTDEKRCLAFELVERGFDVWVSSLSPPEMSDTDSLVWQQPWQQVLEKVNPLLTQLNTLLGFFY